MSRFSNLEFSEGNEFQSGAQPALKDEAYYFTTAGEFFRNGRFEPALRAYSKVLEFNPNNTAAWAGQVRMLIELGEFPEAKLWADKALERFPHDAELLAAKSVALGRMGDLQAALAFSDASMEQEGDAPYLWLARADVLLARAEKRAEYCFAKALGHARTDWFFHWLAARIYAFHRKLALALKSAQQAIELDSSRGVAWLLLGECQMALGLTAPAQRSFAQTAELDATCPGLQEALRQVANLGLLQRLRRRWHSLFES